MGKKEAWPLEKPLRMAYMCFASIKIKPFFLIARRISEAAIGGVRAGDLIFLSLCGPVERKKPMTRTARLRVRVR
jgi:hypothetical protein